MKDDRIWERLYTIPQKAFSFHASQPVLLLRGLIFFALGLFGVFNPPFVLTMVTMFVGGVLVPNLEFGHLKMRDKSTGKNADAEKLYSDAVRKANDLSWKSWAGGLNKYLKYLHALARPELIIIGGGVSAKSEKFFKYLDVPCEVVPAKLENRAGIIGAAFGAYSSIK